MLKLNSKQLRTIDVRIISGEVQSLVRKPIVMILENVYDTFNIGGIFRLADALGVAKIYLCGETTTPPNSRIHKASCGTYKVVPWTYCKTARDAIVNFQTSKEWEGVKKIIAIEQSPASLPYTSIHPSYPLALVVGNETNGITLETLALCDTTVEIPMWGINKSLNVIVSASIVSYHFIAGITNR